MDNREGNWASQNGYESVHVEKNTLDRRPDLGTTVRSAAANLCPTSDVMEIVQALENLRKSGLVRMGQLISEYKEDQPKVQEFLGEPLKTQGLNGKFLGIIPVEYARDLRAIQAIVRTGIESASRDPSIRETEISLMERTLSSFSELYRGSGLGETRILYLGMGYWCVAMGQKAWNRNKDVRQQAVLAPIYLAAFAADTPGLLVLPEDTRHVVMELMFHPVADRIAMYRYSAICPFRFENMPKKGNIPYFNVPNKLGIMLPLGAISLAEGSVPERANIDIFVDWNRPGLILDAVMRLELLQSGTSKVMEILKETIQTLASMSFQPRFLQVSAIPQFVESITTILEFSASESQTLRNAGTENFWQTILTLRPRLVATVFNQQNIDRVGEIGHSVSDTSTRTGVIQ